MLIIDSLSNAYGNKKVLKGITASFADGQVHGIVGLNGAGKTTFFSSICGLIPFEGSITHSSYAPIKNYIGYVPTEPYFFPRVKGMEYLHFVRHAKGEAVIAPELLNMFDLPLNEYVDNYSTGMKRKIAFLGAMIGNSEIYILDEPFNGVDIKSNLVLKRMILELKARHKTIFISSHIVSSLTELCDQVYLLKDGLITRQYAPGEFQHIEPDLLDM